MLDMHNVSKTEQMMRKLAGTPVWFKDCVTDEFVYMTPYEVLQCEYTMQLLLQEDWEAPVTAWTELLREPPSSHRSGWNGNCFGEMGKSHLEFIHLLNHDAIHGPYFEIHPDPYPCDAYGECCEQKKGVKENVTNHKNCQTYCQECR